MYGAVNKSVTERGTSAHGVPVALSEKRRGGELEAVVVSSEGDSDKTGDLGGPASETIGQAPQEILREEWDSVGKLAGSSLCVRYRKALICPKSADHNRLFVKW